MRGTTILQSTPKAPVIMSRLAAPVTGAIALKLLLLFVLAWNSRFVMDEFWQLGQSKFLFEGLFDTMWPGKAVGFALFYEPVHWFGLEAGPTMLAGRLQTALLACATVAMVYACARAIGEDKTRSLLIVLVLLSFSTFMERIFRTISEPLAVFFAVGALLTVLRGNLDRRTPLFLAGVLAGLSFLATQKAVYFDVALGIAKDILYVDLQREIPAETPPDSTVKVTALRRHAVILVIVGGKIIFRSQFYYIENILVYTCPEGRVLIAVIILQRYIHPTVNPQVAKHIVIARDHDIRAARLRTETVQFDTRRPGAIAL